MISTKENRPERLSIRATAKQKEIIAKAASRSNKTISDFVLENSLDAARAVEMDDADLVMSREDYDAFVIMLDEPPRSVPALKQLFSDPTSLDAPNN